MEDLDSSKLSLPLGVDYEMSLVDDYNRAWPLIQMR